MSTLYPCPYNRAAKCNMEKPCLGCEDFKPKRMVLIYIKKHITTDVSTNSFIPMNLHVLLNVVDEEHAKLEVDMLRRENSVIGYKKYSAPILYDENIKEVCRYSL